MNPKKFNHSDKKTFHSSKYKENDVRSSEKILVAGIHPVEEALEALPKETLGASKLYIADTRSSKDLERILSLSEAAGLQPQPSTMPELDRLSPDTRHQGVILVLPRFEYTELEEVLEHHLSKTPLLLLLDQIQDPHNLGAIIRSAVAFRADAILIPKDRCAQITSTSLKTSAGLAYKIPIVQVTNLAMTIRKLRDLDFEIYGADIEGTNVSAVPWNRSIALVMGSESHGMRKLTRDLCDQFVRIDVAPEVDSLNVSVAAAILLYQRASSIGIYN